MMDSLKFYEWFSVLIFWSCVAPQVSTTCQNKYVLNRGLSCEDKELILEMHNQLRSTVAQGYVPGQPAASSMMLISWDEELARKAQGLADTCHYGHDSNQARAVSRFFVGQNIATTWSTWERSPEPDFATQIKAWFDEVGIYSFNAGFTHATGHYSQMVWGDTYLIGCGFTYYYDGRRYQKIYVCNYGPGGNVNGKPPYYPGSPSCYQNGMVSSSKYYGLCDSYRTYYPDYQCTRYRRATDAGQLRQPITSEISKTVVKQTPPKKASSKSSQQSSKSSKSSKPSKSSKSTKSFKSSQQSSKSSKSFKSSKFSKSQQFLVQTTPQTSLKA